MSIIQSYPKGTPKADDLVLGTVVPKANSDDLPVTRNFSISDVASFSSSSEILKQKEITITPAEMLALNGGGVIEIIPAAGAGQLTSLLNMAMFLDYGGTVYDFATPGLSNTITFKLGAANTFHTLSTSTELNITQDRYTVFDFPNNDEMVYEPNTAFTLTATSGVTVSQGNSPIKLSVLYRIVNFT